MVAVWGGFDKGGKEVRAWKRASEYIVYMYETGKSKVHH